MAENLHRYRVFSGQARHDSELASKINEICQDEFDVVSMETYRVNDNVGFKVLVVKRG